MPKKKRIPTPLPPDDLVLAALERAQLHDARETDRGVLLGTLKEHLGLDRAATSTKRLKPQLDSLQTGGYIDQYRQHGCLLWRLTGSGQKLLAALHAANALDPLPEAPQHHRWRHAQETSNARLEEFREDLRNALTETSALLDAAPHASQPWFEISDRLHRRARRLAIAIHCLYEWPEPQDSNPDTDSPPPGQHGRRRLEDLAN